MRKPTVLILSFFGLGISAALLCLASTVHSSQGSVRESLLRQFENPPDEYGPIDCWWWEAGHLSKEKINWQLQELKDKGVAGTWFYPRFPGYWKGQNIYPAYGEDPAAFFDRGLGDQEVQFDPLSSDPPYWTEGWWDFTRYALQEHSRLGLIQWFCDWTAHQFHHNRLRKERRSNPELAGRRLAIREMKSKGTSPVEIGIPAGEEIIDAAAYQETPTGIDYKSRRPLLQQVRNGRLTWIAPESGWLVSVITTQTYDLDYLNRKVADRWIELLLGEYEKRAPEFVGKALKAYGPDEMWLLMGNILYSPSIVRIIQSERGYEVLPYLIALFHDIGPKTDQIRCDYYGTMSRLLEENFYKPISQWLSDRGMQYTTIATWGRQDPLAQTFHYGDFFRYMRWFHITGNEDPYRTEVGARAFIDSKLSSSIANIYGRHRSAMCVYWCSGWGVTQEENLAWTNENVAYGLNLYNRHGGQYTLMGGWYEWVPPSDHFYQPHWRYWRNFTDHIKRLSFIMSQGDHRADVALLYPLTTMHANWIAGRASGPFHRAEVEPAFHPAAKVAAEKMMELAQTIYRSGIDFDFVDNSSIENAVVRGDTLQVSGVEIRCVLLPPLTTVHTAVLEKISAFYESGGTVIAFGRLPDASAEKGRNDPYIRKLIEKIFGVGSDKLTGSSIKNNSPRGGKAFFIPDDERMVPEAISGAIKRDLVASENGVFHTHRKIDNLDIYFVFNSHAQKRRLTLECRVKGEPEIWDTFTGQVHPVHRFHFADDATRVALDVQPYQGLVLIFSPASFRPAVLEDNVSSIQTVTAQKGEIGIEGFDESGGGKLIRAAYQGKEYLSSLDLTSPPHPIRLGGPFTFRLDPTMDNRWGDFRYPPSREKIGAEARRFRYQEESEVSGTELEWQQAGFDDSNWPEVTYSYGPYWWHIGPFQEGSEPLGFLTKAKRGEVEQRYYAGSRTIQWQPYAFSQKFGHSGNEVHTDFRQGSLLGVSENFLVFDAVPNMSRPTHYLASFVFAPADGEATLHFGGKHEKADFYQRRHPRTFHVPVRRQAWVNGEQVLLVDRGPDGPEEEVQAPVRLNRGWNSVLLKIVQPQGEKVATYAVLLQSPPPPADAYIPLLRWFREPQQLVYDLTPNKPRRVGWYRFPAPPGLRSLYLTVKARHVQAWVNGVSVPVEQGRITLKPSLKASSQVALRVEQEPGLYAGAAFLEPVAFDCDAGEIPLGDWSRYGLAFYSGVGVYSKAVRLEREHLGGKVLLDLGQANTVAEVLVNGKSAGVRMGRPFHFDVSPLVKEGENSIEIRVANTLANHMSSYPTKWILEGQTTSGLLGPVELRFLSRLAAKALPVE